jgi:hypothetical protein
VSRTGRYRVFPIVGTAVLSVGIFLLAKLSPDTSTLQASLFMFVTGCGIGLVMQVLVVAVQNAVDYEDLGVATSGNTLLRNIGSSVGTAIIGTIFATELAANLLHDFPHSPQLVHSSHTVSAAALAQLPPSVRATFLDAYSSALNTAFRVAGFISIVAFVASWFVKELPMRTTVTANGPIDSFAAPRPPDSLAEIARSLSVLVGRKKMLDYLRRLTVEAGVDLPLAECWVLVQFRYHPGWDREALMEQARNHKIEPEVVDAAVVQVIERGLATEDLELTPRGIEIADRLRATLRSRLEGLLEGWSPEQYPDLVSLLDQFATEIVADPTVVPAGSSGALPT